MKELAFIEVIKNTLSNNSYIGDDCAYLKDLGIVITQDSLVEDIHFSRKFITPYELGYKAISVNLSDIFASGASPKYLTISLSLPADIDNEFIKEFYKACNTLAEKFDFEIVGGDITGSDKIFISICAIGLTENRNISSRSNARHGDLVITTGVHGSSAAGLFLLQNDKEILKDNKFVKAHLMPEVSNSFSNEISGKIKRDYAMMDTSDGLVDALFKISQSSNVLLFVDFEKVPFDNEIIEVANQTNKDYKDWVLYGGEDYKIVACLDKENLEKLDSSLYTVIGEVKEKIDENFVEIIFDDKIEKINDLEKTYNHFSSQSNLGE